MARRNQFPLIPPKGLGVGCSTASRYDGDVRTDYAMSNAPPSTLTAPSSLITPNSQCCWTASISGHFSKGGNDWNETSPNGKHIVTDANMKTPFAEQRDGD
ncbi:hypothetical protein N7486_005042 [Penicillium sp. IBT 16267x]|nr:hypothetical protein N7486_005042 [Penicillium sp. IBT 16267x]